MQNKQPLKYLTHTLSSLASSEHYLFLLSDLRALLPQHSDGAFKTLLSRANKSCLLVRVCRGVYLYPAVAYPKGLLLYHVAALLRAGDLNYISLETALSNVGIISQIPFNWITVMTSGRSNTVRCGSFGTIEFIHTDKNIEKLIDHLVYEERCHMWLAGVSLALQDMKMARRNMDLIDWTVVNESL
ncbi:MAG: hypothetical protein U9R29_08945 [Thermodesulfobacteriota bacterium]|nr:hypothetical protein [Thermodesulfobacteriota bacterium]